MQGSKLIRFGSIYTMGLVRASPPPTPVSLRRFARWSGVPLAVLVVAFPRDALAYIDAGTTSMLLQAAIASITAAAFLAKAYWRRLKAVFGGKAAGDDARREVHPANDSD